MPTTPPQNDSSSPSTSGDKSLKRPTTPLGASAVRSARDHMAFSNIRANSARGVPRSTDAEDRRHKHNFARTLTVHRGIHIKGSLQDVERLVVEGTVVTEHLSAKELVIAHGGHFEGIAEVDIAEVSGILDGELTAKASLHVCSTGRLNGNAACRRLQVEDGGEIVGKLDMLNPSPSHTMSSESKENKDNHNNH